MNLLPTYALLATLALAAGPEAPTKVTIVTAPEAPSPERLAAERLARYVQRLYPRVPLEVSTGVPRAGRAIFVGSIQSTPELEKNLGGKLPSEPESFVVTTSIRENREVAWIAGADPRGTVYGVQAVLRTLGCGFYLTGDVLPAPRTDDLSFEGWACSDAPLVRERIVFNWHNFLSGCSTWDLEDWEHWITQSQKMGYNAVMVHAYGNNPMVSFEFGGKAKPVGYLSTTVKGRDWSTQHVNDVRRLWGGSVFDGPVFGAKAARVPDEKRVEAAQDLMRGTFQHAEECGMDVYLAIDVDTESANPQELIQTLPESARFPIAMQGRTVWLADPETPEGYLYNKAQVEAALKAYPQVDCLVVWFRTGRTPWRTFQEKEMPSSWQIEYRAHVARTPAIEELWQPHNFFALGKIVAAWDRALAELGRDDIELAVGSWAFSFLPPADRFLPEDVKFLPLDYAVLGDKSQLDSSERRKLIASVGKDRPVVPVVWAHHDDGHYVGRPYAPYPDFHDKLVDSSASGFGIIHWTTRPLDLYFLSLAQQVWRSTKNRPLRETCEDMAARSFGEQNRKGLGEYLLRWVTEAPMLGRDTSDYFIDRPLPEPRVVEDRARGRRALLEEADGRTTEVGARNRVRYFRGLERYVIDVHETEAAFRRAKELLGQGKFTEAREALRGCRPEEVIERYADFSRRGGVTRGEQGLVVSMNLRWLSHIIRLRQALGLEPIRYNFAPTSHDPLAQHRGTFTFHFTRNQEMWQSLGTEETGFPAFRAPEVRRLEPSAGLSSDDVELASAGIELEKPGTFPLRPILGARGQRNLLPGEYRLEVLFLRPSGEHTDPCAFGVALHAAGRRKTESAMFEKSITLEPTTSLAAIWKLRQEVKLEQPCRLELTVTPIRGKVRLCGVVLAPCGSAIQ